MAKRFMWVIVLLLSHLVVWSVSRNYYSDKYYLLGYNQLKQEILSVEWSTLWGEIQKYKENNNLPSLLVDQKLCEFSKIRAEEVSGDWSHDGFRKDPRLKYDVYCKGCTNMGENLARAFHSPDEVMAAWIHSPTHKKILDGPDTRACLGYFEKNGEMFISFISAR